MNAILGWSNLISETASNFLGESEVGGNAKGEGAKGEDFLDQKNLPKT